MTEVFSQSKINAYRHCPMKYYYQYVKKISIEVVSPWIEIGIEVHSLISQMKFEHKDEQIKIMLDNAKSFIELMPPNPILETSYEDKNNPGKFFGEVFDRKFTGIFDYHWIDYLMAGDWKTGKFNSRFTDSLEIQAHILNQLYEQKYGKRLKRFYFNFIKFGINYEAVCINSEKKEKDIEFYINNALENIEDKKFPRKNGILCQYCYYKGLCESENLGGKRNNFVYRDG